ncbi:MAG: PEP-CTERM sorting domain-containing protein [Thiobacillus sp.]|nr:PEP-CTERM sorting domain-containing protein [Thiobacillus sp.]
MNFKLNALVAAALLVAAGSANAAMSGATSGNGELLINFISQGGTSATAGGDDMSAVFDLGVSMNDFLTHKNQAGYTQTWSLTGANYGSAWSDLLAFSANDAAIEFNVIALDNVNTRYLTTNDIATYSSLTNANLGGFQNMDLYVNANNLRGSNATEVNGASTALASDVANSYFRAVNGAGQGDTWLTKTTDTTKNLATAQNFWSLSVGAGSGSSQASKSAFGVDLNGNGSIGTGEFGEWSVNMAAGTVTFANPAAPVPEASTYGMMLAGLGLVGFMARRRLAA